MNKKWLHKLIENSNKSDGVAIMALVVLLVMMTIMGGAFASIMGGWKTSAPYAINSNRAAQLANSAAVFALQNAKENIDAANYINCGLRLALVTVISDDGNGGSADYWIERPSQGGTLASSNDDFDTGPDDDDYDDDVNDVTDPDLFTIIATGRVTSGGVLVAKRQVKIFVDYTATAPSVITPKP